MNAFEKSTKIPRQPTKTYTHPTWLKYHTQTNYLQRLLRAVVPPAEPALMRLLLRPRRALVPPARDVRLEVALRGGDVGALGAVPAVHALRDEERGERVVSVAAAERAVADLDGVLGDRVRLRLRVGEGRAAGDEAFSAQYPRSTCEKMALLGFKLWMKEN